MRGQPRRSRHKIYLTVFHSKPRREACQRRETSAAQRWNVKIPRRDPFEGGRGPARFQALARRVTLWRVVIHDYLKQARLRYLDRAGFRPPAALNYADKTRCPSLRLVMPAR